MIDGQDKMDKLMFILVSTVNDDIVREAAKYYSADLFCEGGAPPPTPLAENYFAKKKLAELGGTLLAPLTEKIC